MAKVKKCKIWCVSCDRYVDAELTSGKYVYRNRPDLANIPLWRCPDCKNTVGTHYKSKTPLKPLGVIADYRMKILRRNIHSILDPMWKSGVVSRANVYKYISKAIGHEYHTANIKTLAEAKEIIEIIERFKKQLRRKGFVFEEHCAIIKEDNSKKGGQADVEEITVDDILAL